MNRFLIVFKEKLNNQIPKGYSMTIISANEFVPSYEEILRGISQNFERKVEVPKIEYKKLIKKKL